MKKTLLLSISNTAINRNFTGFSGSVLDILSQNEELHVVVLVRKGQSFIDSLRHYPITVEEIGEEADRSLVQSAFNFFYSFLIFTDTTKLVSSYGVRADRPRPIIRYWNYPLKWLIANTFGRVTWIKTILVPRIYLGLFPSRYYMYLFEKYKPDALFAPNICIWPTDLQLIVEAQRSKVPVIGMHGNWDHFSKYFVPFRPHHLVVWSEPVKAEAIDFQCYNSKDVTVTGAPHADFFLDPDNRLPREVFLKSFDIPPDATLISFGSQGPYSLDGADLVDMMLTWSEEGTLPKNTYVIIRPHPSGIMEIEKYERFKNHRRIRMDNVKDAFTPAGFKHYINFLYHADALVTTFSTVGPDAVLLDRSVVIAGFDGYRVRPMHQSVRRHKMFTHYRMILQGKSVYHATSPDSFLEHLRYVLKHPDANSEGRDELKRQVFGYVDMKNSQRVADAVTSFLNG